MRGLHNSKSVVRNRHREKYECDHCMRGLHNSRSVVRNKHREKKLEPARYPKHVSTSDEVENSNPLLQKRRVLVS